MAQPTTKKLVTLTEATASVLENVAVLEGRPQSEIVEQALALFFAAREGEREEWTREVTLTDGTRVQLREPIRVRVPAKQAKAAERSRKR
jgi:hypothetical protein